MKQLGVIGLLAAGLTACASIVNPVTQTQVFEMENAYGVVQAQAIAYASFGLCPKGTTISGSVSAHCALPQAVVAIAKADSAARDALTLAANFVRNTPTVNAGSVIAAAQQAIALAVQTEANFGVGGGK